MNALPLLNPSLLYFLPIAAIPVILHLFTLFRVKTVDLSTYRFLFDSYVQQRRKTKFVEALIALLRTLFLLLLVGMLARPAIQHWDRLFGGGGSGRDVVLLVDTSVSMNTTAAGKSALDRAKGVAREIADRLGPEDRLTLFRLGSRPEEVFSRFAGDTQAIHERIDSLKAGSSRANMLAAFTQIFGPQAPPRDKPVVYLLSDGQETGWRELKSQALPRLLPEGSQLHVVQCGSNAPLSNRGIVGDGPRQVRATVGLPLKLRPRVVNHSDTESADVLVSVQLDDREIARPGLLLKPGETASAEVIHTPTEPGVYQGRFVLERPDAGLEDGFPDDDNWLFTLVVSEPLRVLLVNGAPAADPFDSETLFLKTALAAPTEDELLAANGGVPPGGASAGTPPGQGPAANNPGQAGGRVEYAQSLLVTEIDEGKLNEEALKGVGVVVLANCGQLNGNQFTMVRNHVNGGGGLLVFPGDKVNPKQYNEQFFTIPNAGGKRFTALQLGAPTGNAADNRQFVRLAGESLDFGHPVLQVFDAPRAKYLAGARFYRHFPAEVPPGDDPQRAYHVLARYGDESPALVESRFGEGRMLLATFPASGQWSNLPLRPEFVPLVLRMVQHVEQRATVESPSVVAPGTKAEIAVAREWEPVQGKVTDPAGREAPLEFLQSGSRFLAAVEQTGEKGFYQVDVQGRTGDEPRRGEARFAVNLSPDESNFNRLAEDDLKGLFPETEVTFFDASAEAQQEFGRVGGEAREIWRWLIALMFLVIAGEFWLSTLGGRRPEASSDDDDGDTIPWWNPAGWVGRATGSATPGDAPG